MSKNKWHKFRAGERAWSPSNGWVTLFEHSPGLLGDGRWLYEKNGVVVGLSVPVPMLFRNEIKPEDWPQPEPPLPDLKDGDPIWVRDSEDQPWAKKIFVRFNSYGRILVYKNGNKWTSGGVIESWSQYRIPTPEELQ